MHASSASWNNASSIANEFNTGCLKKGNPTIIENFKTSIKFA